MLKTFTRLFGNPPAAMQQETTMPEIPKLRPSVIGIIAALEAAQAMIGKQAETISEKNAGIAALSDEMKQLKEMIDAKLDNGGSSGGVVD